MQVESWLQHNQDLLTQREKNRLMDLSVIDLLKEEKGFEYFCALNEAQRIMNRHRRIRAICQFGRFIKNSLIR